MKKGYTEKLSNEEKVAEEGYDGGEEQTEEIKIRRFRPPRGASVIAIAVLAILLFIATILFIVFVSLYASRSDSSSGSDVCQTDACFEVAVQIKGSMDETVDPCQDFYNFTCGNWQFFNHIPPDEYGTSTFEQLQFSVYSKIANTLETVDFARGNAVLTELSDFYKSCISAQMMNDSDVKDQLVPVIREAYQTLGGWSLVGIPGDGTQWSINSNQFIRAKRLGGVAFYTIGGDLNNDTVLVPQIEESGLTLDYYLYYNDSNFSDSLGEMISVFLNELAQGTPVPEGAVRDIVNFEISLAAIWDDTVDLYSDNYTSYTVQQLYNIWPYHDWLKVLQGILEPSGVTINRQSIVQLKSAEYFQRLSTLVKSTSNDILENYAKWAITWQFADLFITDSEVRESLVLFRKKVLGKPTMDQQQTCIDEVDSILPVALARIYAQHILPSGYVEAGTELAAGVMKGLRQRMMELEWLDSETRKLSIEKLDAIESRIAYPARTFENSYLNSLYGEYKFDETKYVANYLQYLNVSVRQQYSLFYKPLDRSIWLVSPVTVNAYYVAIFNQISITEAIMQSPFLNIDWPLSMQYGALGTVVGHELTHGFDNSGRQYDKDGKRRMWWSQSAIDTFEDRTMCFVDQYSNYGLYGYNIDGNLTLGENIADNGGMQASFEAFKRDGRRSKSLPGLNYTDEQLFFIAFSQVWCSSSTPTSFSYSVRFDVHSPDPFRVIGTLSNTKAFAKAFNCPSDSPMNPPDKCVLW